jgi:hypothetical protein
VAGSSWLVYRGVGDYLVGISDSQRRNIP